MNKLFDNKIKAAVIKKAKKNDWRKAFLTELKTSSYFNATNLIKKPTTALVPAIDKNKET